MRETMLGNIDLEVELQPETSLEKDLLAKPEFLRGLFWGVPRYGHPEGEVYKHIREVLANIERLQVDASSRRRLRLIAYVHDTFKYCEDKSYPRDWSRHHGILARHFLAPFTEDEELLDIVELHDEAYYCWRTTYLYHEQEEGRQRLEQLLDRLGEARQLYYLFFKCDTLTGDKNLAPLFWFEQTIPEINIVQW